MDIEETEDTGSLSGDTDPLIESQPQRSDNPTKEDLRREQIEHLTKWGPVTSVRIDPASIDYSVFPEFWEGAGVAGVKRHRKEFRKRLLDAVEHDDAITLGKLLQLPMRVPCCFLLAKDDFVAKKYIETRGMLTFAPGELLENNLESRRPRDPQDFNPTPNQQRRANAFKPSGCSFGQSVPYVNEPTFMAILRLVITVLMLCGFIGYFARPDSIFLIASIILTLMIITIAIVVWECTFCCTFKDNCWWGCMRIGPWYRHMGFDCAHRVHSLILRVCGPRFFWCCCCQPHYTGSSDMVADGFGRWGPESAQMEICCSNWDPQIISCGGMMSHLCGSLATEDLQFALLQYLLEEEGDYGYGRSVLTIAARRGNAAVLELLRPHGVDHLVRFYARARWSVAHEALAEAITVAARYADALYRDLHTTILEELEGTARPISHNAQSLYLPPAPRPCARDVHVPSAQPQCPKCQSRLHCETQEQYAALLTRHHVRGQDAKFAWSNSNALRWATPECHVEMAKLYCPKLGEHTDALAKTDFHQLDATALFNMLSWCNGVSEAMRGPEGTPTNCTRTFTHCVHFHSLVLYFWSALRFVHFDVGPTRLSLMTNSTF